MTQPGAPLASKGAASLKSLRLPSTVNSMCRKLGRTMHTWHCTEIGDTCDMGQAHGHVLSIGRIMTIQSHCAAYQAELQGRRNVAMLHIRQDLDGKTVSQCRILGRTLMAKSCCIAPFRQNPDDRTVSQCRILGRTMRMQSEDDAVSQCPMYNAES